MKNLWIVTRQCYWPDGRNVVEIALGGLDYCNPNALCRKYAGEFEEFSDPREAAETAISICRQWRKDSGEKIAVAHGCTGGYTMPFDDDTFANVKAWAEETWEKLPKCPQCGDVMGKERWRPYEWSYGEDEEVCSERCCEKVQEEQERFNAVEST